ncbi:hypothetical protein ATANTOWER_019289 [Ataeniobius toweri]|uniref:Uncharacterized protein n=1 Tax=Ataeniobius toweri TaxID=208326 RepID=A0ABU7BTE9_9TELE|nr:hypothetical protein [Ataeniobius toweri]
MSWGTPKTAGSNPCSVRLNCCVLGQDTSPALPAIGGQRRRLYGSPASVSLPQGSCGYNVAYHCQCVNVCVNVRITDCSVKRFGVLGLYRVPYKFRPFTIQRG